MASIIAQRVFLEIKTIARSDASLQERRAKAARRIDQFKAEFAAALVWPIDTVKQIESLRKALQRAATQHNLTAEENSVYAEALEVLMGQAH